MKRLFPLTILLASLSSHAQYTNISFDFDSEDIGEIWGGGVAKYNYTDGIQFIPSFASDNSLVFGHGPSTKILITEDPLDASNKVLWINGANNVAKEGGGGVFFMNLDLTGEGTYTSGVVRVDYAFRMLRDGFNENSPTSWEIAWVTRPETDETEYLDAWTWAGETVIDSFRTSGDENNWVSVEGFFVADLAAVDTVHPLNNGLHVGALDGGWVTGGQGIYYIDDILVTLSQGDVVEPTTWAGYEVDEETGNVDTGSWMGLLYVEHAPFIYSYDTGGWMYIDQESIGPENGSWVYLIR